MLALHGPPPIIRAKWKILGARLADRTATLWRSLARWGAMGLAVFPPAAATGGFRDDRRIMWDARDTPSAAHWRCLSSDTCKTDQSCTSDDPQSKHGRWLHGCCRRVQ